MQKSKKNILLTFDYELFLGKNSGTIEKSIIQPVEEILRVLKAHSGKAIFFVDATFLVKLKNDSTELFNDIKKNIQDIVQNGHNVELHLHPQWLDSEFNENMKTWSFTSLDKYRLHSLSVEMREKVFSDSLTILNEIIREVKLEYKVSAFRAGGWCSQPFNEILPMFLKHGIDIDFSVVPNATDLNSVRYFDYRHASLNKEYWLFSEDNSIEDSNGKILEVPCSQIKLSHFSFLKNKLEIKGIQRYGNGKGAVEASTFFQKIKKLQKRTISLNIDFMSLNAFKKSIENSKKKNLVVVGHPKILSTLGLDCIEYLVKNHHTIGIEELRTEARFEKRN